MVKIGAELPSYPKIKLGIRFFGPSCMFSVGGSAPDLIGGAHAILPDPLRPIEMGGGRKVILGLETFRALPLLKN